MSACAVPTTFGKTKETARIVIIGAGASGIAAATRLLEQGFKNVQLFEAEDRIGGRINTIPFANSFIDMGAQWCHGEEGNVVFEKVKDLDVLDRTGDFAVYFVRSNKEILSDDQTKALKEFQEEFEIKPDCEGSVGDAITESYWKEVGQQVFPNDKTVAKEALDCMKKVICSEDACDYLSELSPRNYRNFEMCGGDQNLSWRRKGYWKFLSVILNSNEDQPGDQGILKGHVHLNRRIAEINWSGDGELTLRCWNGQLVAADHVICTVSLGVLKEKHNKLFVPALPAAKVRSIEGLKARHCGQVPPGVRGAAVTGKHEGRRLPLAGGRSEGAARWPVLLARKRLQLSSCGSPTAFARGLDHRGPCPVYGNPQRRKGPRGSAVALQEIPQVQRAPSQKLLAFSVALQSELPGQLQLLPHLCR